jgi:hypothetical protein
MSCLMEYEIGAVYPCIHNFWIDGEGEELDRVGHESYPEEGSYDRELCLVSGWKY